MVLLDGATYLFHAGGYDKLECYYILDERATALRVEPCRFQFVAQGTEPTLQVDVAVDGTVEEARAR